MGLHIEKEKHSRKNRYTTKVAGCVLGENRLYSMLQKRFWAQPATRNSNCAFVFDGFREISRRFAVDKASFFVRQYIVFYRWTRIFLC